MAYDCGKLVQSIVVVMLQHAKMFGVVETACHGLCQQELTVILCDALQVSISSLM